MPLPEQHVAIRTDEWKLIQEKVNFWSGSEPGTVQHTHMSFRGSMREEAGMGSRGDNSSFNGGTDLGKHLGDCLGSSLGSNKSMSRSILAPKVPH